MRIKMKKKLLLHSCCGPCSTVLINDLSNEYDITVYYYNPNIEPNEEYELRKEEQIKFLQKFNKEIKIITPPYNNQDYQSVISDYQDLGEKTIRCYECYKLRIDKTAKYASDNNYDYFDTTLSISPHKNSIWIKEIGFLAEEKYKVKYLAGDYKKQDGYKRSIELAKKYDLYRQEYCGCLASAKHLNLDSKI